MYGEGSSLGARSISGRIYGIKVIGLSAYPIACAGIAPVVASVVGYGFTVEYVSGIIVVASPYGECVIDREAFFDGSCLYGGLESDGRGCFRLIVVRTR